MSGRSLDSVIRDFPDFQPAKLLRNGHAQTIIANLAAGPHTLHNARQHRVLLDDGDLLVLHENRPEHWRPTDPTALLIHGLAGCADSGYMMRIATKLNHRGVRVMRMDLRGIGAGEGLARRSYHPGISQDVFASTEYLARKSPLSPISIVGFSIGGNITLKMLGENPDRVPRQVDRAIAVNPPIDLPRCLKDLYRFPRRLYNRHFVGLLFKQLRQSDSLVQEAPHVANVRRPRGLREFDSLYTANVWGYESIDRFYEDNSALPHIADISIPSLVIASRDDPLVPVETFETLSTPNAVTVNVTDHGGHLGFIGRSGLDPDRRWMDWRIIDWILAERPRAVAAIAA